jgi:hypothetical protein
MYEVKSKATMEHVDRVFKFNNTYAGSFKRFCGLYNNPKKPNQKMFMVVLPRNSIKKLNGAVHPVYVAEIDTVLLNPSYARILSTTNKRQWAW